MNNIRMLRKKANMTQTELGKILGVQDAAISKYESGKIPLTTDAIDKLSTLFDVSADFLLGKTSNPNTALTDKDRKNISKRLEQLKNDLEKNEGLSYYGEPLNEEAKQSILAAMKEALTITQRENKKFIRKDYRNDN